MATWVKVLLASIAVLYVLALLGLDGAQALFNHAGIPTTLAGVRDGLGGQYDRAGAYLDSNPLVFIIGIPVLAYYSLRGRS